jgi:sugar phosphate isomerase/epimerase
MIKEGNFAGLLKTLKEIGVERIELCSALGYSDFSSLSDGKEVRKILSDHGLGCESAHFSMRELREMQDKSIAWAKDVGITQMVTATLGTPQPQGTPVTMDYLKKAADEYNKIAAVAAKAGIQQGLHNEGLENSMLEGRKTYDILLELLDPKLVKMQFQMSSIRVLGDPVEYFTKHPGRFISMHLQDVDLKEAAQTAPSPAPQPAQAGGGQGAAPQGSGGRGGRGARAVGKGSIDWVKTFQAARVGGVKNYFVEQNMELTKESVAFLKTLKV